MAVCVIRSSGWTINSQSEASSWDMEEVTTGADSTIGKRDYVMWLCFTRSADAVLMMRTWKLDAKADC